MNSSRRVVPFAAMSIGAFILAAGGCESPQRRDTAQYPVRDTAKQPAKQDMRQAQARRGQVFGVSEMSFPTGDEQSSLVRVSTSSTQEQVRVGQPYVYELNVTNLSDDLVLENVTIHQDIPGSMQIAGVRPEGITQGDQPGTWSVGQLSPGQTKTFEVGLVPQEAGNFETCVRVTYNPVLCTTISVVAPELRLIKESPQRALLCEPIPVRYVVSNTGTGTTEPVVIREQLPDGILGPNGSRELTIDVGPLQAGQSREFTVNLQAQRTGELTNPAIAVSRSGLETRAEGSPTLIWAPQLGVEIQGPETAYTGRPVQYSAVVSNQGSGPALNTTLNLNLPAQTRLVEASQPIEQGGGAIRLGDIPQGESREVTFSLVSGNLGELRLAAMANARCADRVEDVLVTNIRGVTSLLLEVVDNNDPIQVGQEEVYQIGVINQGSIADQNVEIAVIVPEGMEIVSTDGPTRAAVEGGRINFAPLAELGPKQRAVWTVTIRALRPGDFRFQTQLTSQTLTEPVVESEATRAY